MLDFFCLILDVGCYFGFLLFPYYGGQVSGIDNVLGLPLQSVFFEFKFQDWPQEEPISNSRVILHTSRIGHTCTAYFFTANYALKNTD